MKKIIAVIAAIIGLSIAASGSASASPVVRYTKPATYTTDPSANPALPYAIAEILMSTVKPGVPLYLHITVPVPRDIGSLNLSNGVLRCSGCQSKTMIQENGDKANEFTYKIAPATSGSLELYGIVITFRSAHDYSDKSLYPSMWLASK